MWTSRVRSEIARSSSDRNLCLSKATLLVAALTAFAAAGWTALDRTHAGLPLLLVAFALLPAGIAWLHRGPDSAKELALIAFCFVLGLGFSAFMDVWNWLAFYDEHSWQTFAAVQARGLPFDLSHAIGNVLIAFAAGPELRRLLDRYARRLRTEVVWA